MLPGVERNPIPIPQSRLHPCFCRRRPSNSPALAASVCLPILHAARGHPQASHHRFPITGVVPNRAVPSSTGRWLGGGVAVAGGGVFAVILVRGTVAASSSPPSRRRQPPSTRRRDLAESALSRARDKSTRGDAACCGVGEGRRRTCPRKAPELRACIGRPMCLLQAVHGDCGSQETSRREAARSDGAAKLNCLRFVLV